MLLMLGAEGETLAVIFGILMLGAMTEGAGVESLNASSWLEAFTN